MIIKNGHIHDGKGQVFSSPIQIQDGIFKAIHADLSPTADEVVIDAQGLEIFPAFIPTVSGWGINGSATEIRPSSDDNDELSDPITPHLDVLYAYNGRAASIQQLGAFGLAVAGVAPTDNNLFGGTMAVFEVDGVNPFDMCVKSPVGMKASVSNHLKIAYGKRNIAPMTKMWIFQQLGEQFRAAKEYKYEEGKERNVKAEALQKVLRKELPLFLSCDSEQDALHAYQILKEYDIDLVLCNGYGLTKDSTWLIDNDIPLVVRSESMTMQKEDTHVDLEAIASLYEKGLKVALSGTEDNWQSRDALLWQAINMMKILRDENKVLPMITSTPAQLLSIDQLTGSIEEGKRADFVLWSKNPLESYQAEIITTFMNGQVIYKKGDEMRCM